MLIVDARALIRQGFRALLEREPGVVVVGDAGSPDAARALGVRPDVVVTDIDLPDRRGYDVIGDIRESFGRSAVLVVTSVDHPAKVDAALAAGADGYLLDTAGVEDLLVGIRALAAGQTYLQPGLGVRLARWREPRDHRFDLSKKEEEVLRLLAHGHTNAEVSKVLGVSMRTVETHRARILQKLGLRGRAELVIAARERGLIDLA